MITYCWYWEVSEKESEDTMIAGDNVNEYLGTDTHGGSRYGRSID